MCIRDRAPRWLSSRPTADQSKRAIEGAKNQERIWKLMTPDSSWGLTHPATFILLGAVVGLHYYNNYVDVTRPSDGGSDVQDGRTAKEMETEIEQVRKQSFEEAERRRRTASAR
eukprot:TRINITY_DN18842_c0_g1_i3.p1 TRINITY_DN18842_c0_g1~~TRINITY_DN18842_c0_g1_i3.p1  ORF type:complete len:114 (+),score=25.67 TRINITY_DN18842_c0_g1_i3:183-524(+)